MVPSIGNTNKWKHSILIHLLIPFRKPISEQTTFFSWFELVVCKSSLSNPLFKKKCPKCITIENRIIVSGTSNSESYYLLWGELSKSREVMFQLHRALVRHIWSSVHYWFPYLRKNMSAYYSLTALWEAVHRRFSRLIPGIGGLSDEEQWDSLCLSLASARL